MGLFHHKDSEQAKAHDQLFGDNAGGHKAHLSHELIAAAASYEASKELQKHIAEKNGAAPSHEEAKAILAAAAGLAVTKLVESKGRDAWSEHERKKHAEEAQKAAKQQVFEAYDANYSNNC